MGDVTRFSGGDGSDASARIWVCDCGCSTFEIEDGGGARCANCAVIAHLQIGGWFNESAREVTDIPDRVVAGNGSVDFLRHRMSRMALEEETVGIVLMREGGEVTFMQDASTKERRKWFRRRLRIAKKMLKGAM